MLDTMMKVSLTLVAFDKMSKVIRDAVTKSNSEFDKLQNKIKRTSETLTVLMKLFHTITLNTTGLKTNPFFNSWVKT